MPLAVEQCDGVTRRSKRELTEKQLLFIEEFQKDFDAGAAYIRAGYEVSTKAIAEVNGARLLRNARITQAIDAGQIERCERLRLDADWVVQRLVGVYTRAIVLDDLQTARTTLVEIGRHLGIFERDNRQRAGQDEERLVIELRQRGVPIDRLMSLPGRAHAGEVSDGVGQGGGPVGPRLVPTDECGAGPVQVCDLRGGGGGPAAELPDADGVDGGWGGEPD